MPGLDDAPEVIVVLGGGLLPAGVPDAATLRRAEAAPALALADPDAAVIAWACARLPGWDVRPHDAPEGPRTCRARRTSRPSARITMNRSPAWPMANSPRCSTNS